MLEWRILRPHEYCCVKLAINGSMEIINYKMSNSPNKQQVYLRQSGADCKTCKRFYIPFMQSAMGHVRAGGITVKYFCLAEAISRGNSRNHKNVRH